MRQFLFLFLAVAILMNQEAYAYINPGSGSDFLQMFLALIIAVKKFFKKAIFTICGFFCGSKKSSQSSKKDQ